MINFVIVGKENVGKSTFFNRVLNKNISITDKTPGITRDYVTSKFTCHGSSASITDTAGWLFRKTKNQFYYEIRKVTLSNINNSQVIIFIIDSSKIITNEDIEIARYIKSTKKKIIFIANKSDIKRNISIKEYSIIGLGIPIFISSEHEIGFEKLYRELIDLVEKKEKKKT